MSIPKISEGSASVMEYIFYDKDDVLDTPATIHYRIDDVSSDTVIKASTPVTPAASSGEIDISPTENALQDQENESELRLFTVTLDSGLSSQFHKVYLFEVYNLRAIT